MTERQEEVAGPELLAYELVAARQGNAAAEAELDADQLRLLRLVEAEQRQMWAELARANVRLVYAPYDIDARASLDAAARLVSALAPQPLTPPDLPSPGEFMTTDQVARRLGITKGRLRYDIAHGRIQAGRRDPGHGRAKNGRLWIRAAALVGYHRPVYPTGTSPEKRE